MITSKLLAEAEGLSHGFSDRAEGESTAPYASLNLAYHVGDDAAVVDANHALLAGQLGYAPERLVHMRQIHSDRIVHCTPEMGFHSRPECDALMTDIAGQPLMVMVADCTPVLLYDPRRRAVAAVHAGRAGALKNIVGKTVAAMHDAYGSDPADLLAVLGPSIGSCCYEIGPEVAQEVQAAGCEGALSRRDGRTYLDVNAILEKQLEAAGLTAGHIDLPGSCTACRTDRFFSYRAEGGTTGRQAGIIMIK
ncbi:peptidoglycan editing factor PgeF [Sulfurimonas sp. HSL-3221]|uniref:peptidoglycan editing factor PgeF n=1 Tax=Sulfurimonadaceae TaxID=2771471 RepID=UPI001E42A0B4|nr:peptidoglycan editing factor PgeF [Sulfurimonas sp. HSL-3221]UFS63027.1 peptidoglycan editing factor PgeF [Sulfurimonas sp. HSL-3221]